MPFACAARRASASRTGRQRSRRRSTIRVRSTRRQSMGLWPVLGPRPRRILTHRHGQVEPRYPPFLGTRREILCTRHAANARCRHDRELFTCVIGALEGGTRRDLAGGTRRDLAGDEVGASRDRGDPPPPNPLESSRSPRTRMGGNQVRPHSRCVGEVPTTALGVPSGSHAAVRNSHGS
jgi:hypothetical protein